jgi:hypothetical protein
VKRTIHHSLSFCVGDEELEYNCYETIPKSDILGVSSDDYCETSDVVNSAIRYTESDSRDERSAIAAGPTLTRKAIDFRTILTKIADVFLIPLINPNISLKAFRFYLEHSLGIYYN